MSNLHPETFLALSVFRLQDVCVRIQEDMEDYLATAALEKIPGIEATFRWLRKRRVQVALLSDFNRSDTEILLRRLGWGVGEEELVQLVLTSQGEKDNPVARILELAGQRDGSLTVTVMDTPRLLFKASACKVRLNIGMTHGQSSYPELAATPCTGLLDGPIQLPNFLLERLPELNQVPPIVLRGPGSSAQTRWSGFSTGFVW